MVTCVSDLHIILSMSGLELLITLDGWIDGWMDELMDPWAGEQMHGCMERQIKYMSSTLQVCSDYVIVTDLSDLHIPSYMCRLEVLTFFGWMHRWSVHG